MPRMDGYEVARSLHSLPGRERVILVALSGWGAPEDQARTKAAGFDYHLLKPASMEKLNAVLAALIRTEDEKR
jgi:CheY-like chemotaxis protein